MVKRRAPARTIVPNGTILITILALALAIAVGRPGVALAHAYLVRSDPAANSILDAVPPEVRLWFSEAPEPRFSELHLLDSSGKPVQALGELRSDGSDATLLRATLGTLKEGVYTVTWQTTSAVDGHITRGSFAFVFGRDQAPAAGLSPTAPDTATSSSSGPTVPDTVVRWLGYLGMSFLAGGFAFFPLVLKPALGGNRSGLNSGSAPDRAKAEPEAESHPEPPHFPLWPLGALLIAGWILTLIATFGAAVTQAAASAGVPLPAAIGSPLATLLGHTRYGAIFFMKLLALMGIATLLLFRLSDAVQGRGRSAWWWSGLAASALLLLATSLGGHAAFDSATPFAVVADWAHLMAASIWVGGLGALSLSLPRVFRQSGGASIVPVARVVSRFSMVATGCVVALSLTGPYRMLGELGSWRDLFDTPYGTALLIKLGLLVPLLGLAFVNRFLILHRLARETGATDRTEPNVSGLFSVIRRTVGGEVALVSTILLVTSALTALPPTSDAYGSGLVIRGGAADLRAVLVVSPGHPGINSFDVYLRRGDGSPVTKAERVYLIFEQEEQSSGQTEAEARELGNGRYQTEGGYISLLATWHVQLLVREAGKEDVRIDYTIQPLQLLDGSGQGHAH